VRKKALNLRLADWHPGEYSCHLRHQTTRAGFPVDQNVISANREPTIICRLLAWEGRCSDDPPPSGLEQFFIGCQTFGKSSRGDQISQYQLA
jgi:hypothetical protein